MLSSNLVGQPQPPNRDYERRDQQQYPDQRRDRDGDRNNNRRNTNPDEQKGFSDGLNRGQQDARSHRSATPNNSSHYRGGIEAYRAGFRRGYNEGYRQNSRGGR